MNSLIKPLRLNNILCLFLFLFVLSGNSIGQTDNRSVKPRIISPRIDKEQLQIDSLHLVIEQLRYDVFKNDSLYQQERFVSADLRDQLLKLDDYRKKLEARNTDFKDDNLKLNQSNRILIIFNSLVAILLVVSLIFFVKKISRKKTNATAPAPSAKSETPATVRYSSFEDRLVQLERLGKLREKGLLTDDEFITEKQKVLGK